MLFVSRSVRKTGRRNRTRTPLVEVLNTNTGSQQDKRTSGNKLDRKQESRIPKNKFEQESRTPRSKFEQESRTPQSKFEQESRIVQSRRDQESINNHSDIEENAVFQSELEFEPLIPPAESNTQSISLLSDPSGKKKGSLKANPGETERSAASEGSETENDNTQGKKHFIFKRCQGCRFGFPFPLKTFFVTQHVKQFEGVSLESCNFFGND